MQQEDILKDIIEILDELKKIRKEKGFTQANVASSLCISTDGYRKIENGINVLTLARFLKICETLEVSPVDFFSTKTGHLLDQR